MKMVVVEKTEVEVKVGWDIKGDGERHSEVFYETRNITRC